MGVVKNKAEAVNWFRKSAGQGHAAAQNDLGLSCSDGQGVKKTKLRLMSFISKKLMEAALMQ
jgi:TPR repeat protein